jgi:hypothetical protein
VEKTRTREGKRVSKRRKRKRRGDPSQDQGPPSQEEGEDHHLHFHIFSELKNTSFLLKYKIPTLTRDFTLHVEKMKVLATQSISSVSPTPFSLLHCLMNSSNFSLIGGMCFMQ